MTNSNRTKVSGSRSPSTPPKGLQSHIIGALIGAIAALNLLKQRESNYLLRNFRRTPIFPFEPFFGGQPEPINFGDVLWDVIRTILEEFGDLGEPPTDQQQLLNWFGKLIGLIGTEQEENALLTMIPFAIASINWDDDVVEKMGQELLVHYSQEYGNKWSTASMWIYFIMLRAGIMKKDPIKAMKNEIKKLPEDLVEGISAVLGRGWSPSAESKIYSLSLNCLAHVVWTLRVNQDPAMAFYLTVPTDQEMPQATHLSRIMSGAMTGAVHGIHRIPSSITTYTRLVREIPRFSGREDSTEQVQLVITSLWDLQNMALQLAGNRPVKEAEMEPAVGPIEVGDQVFAANLMGALDAPHGWCVISLCRVGESFSFHSYRRQIYLIDKEGDVNPDLATVVQDAVDAIDLNLSQGRPVLVHCHGGRSRTALILKAWKMRRDGIDEEAAHEWLKSSWPIIHRSNRTFYEFLKNDWPSVMKQLADD